MKKKCMSEEIRELSHEKQESAILKTVKKQNKNKKVGLSLDKLIGVEKKEKKIHKKRR